jgi:hypothetical protein
MRTTRTNAQAQKDKKPRHFQGFEGREANVSRPPLAKEVAASGSG